MRPSFFAQASEALHKVVHKLTSPEAVRIGRLVGWFLLTQAVTIAAMLFFVAAFWEVYRPLGLLACGVGVIVLERKVEINHRATRDP